jgi:mono/diheme cytochrome c family protein
MRGMLLIIAAVLASSILVRAQESRSAREHSRWTAPSDESARTNPLATRSDADAGGKKIFQQRCSTCHGDDAAGTADAPDLTRATVQRQTDGGPDPIQWTVAVR